ncbi:MULTISPECIES: hypothetical protein [Photorhabdus]|uniref:Acyl carrier protein n=1 Tax=Photorhabdus kayaii TaxID=230088 RepID=A0ABX0B3V5_9GAMM|nr:MULTISPECIES: hypothetical protein [Photorhabdus]MCC8374089.1 hypothetical protein [Photorhabdus bodei]MCT8352886.1 hypothetical protein [Photorhabdus kayaii]MDB6368994.1 hypothetical protein [Photorhabdus bodei]NDL12542.1 hypothetical protein [Photorhabdus kayaii]NDL26083.1 hypothetical protein [Photorhabdus kayaii]
MEKSTIEKELKNEIDKICNYNISTEISGDTKLKSHLDSVDILRFIHKINTDYNLNFGSKIEDEKYLDTFDSIVSWVHSSINK